MQLLEGVPGTFDQFLAPARDELVVEVGLERLDRRFGSRVEGPGLPLLALEVVEHQVAHGALHEVAEAAPRWVGAMEIAPQKPDDELLAQLPGDLRVAHGAQEIAVNRAGVAIDELALSLENDLGPAAMGLEDQRPFGRHLAEAWVVLFLLHAAGPRPSVSRMLGRFISLQLGS